MTSNRRPDDQCPLRPGEPCALCQMSTTGPSDCPLVWLVMTDDELRAGLLASIATSAKTRESLPAA